MHRTVPSNKTAGDASSPPPSSTIQNAIALELACLLLRVCGDDDAVAHAAMDVIVARREVQP
jgi:hypothetical protein